LQAPPEFHEKVYISESSEDLKLLTDLFSKEEKDSTISRIQLNFFVLYHANICFMSDGTDGIQKVGGQSTDAFCTGVDTFHIGMDALNQNARYRF
jgi:hypothetical protein